MEMSEPRRLQRVSIHLPDDIHQRLCEQAIREGVGVAELATALLEQAVAEQSLEHKQDDDARSA